MNNEPVMLIAVILVSLTSTLILISKDWRFSISALGAQYIGVFLLVDKSWPIELAITKMVAGWMAGAIIGVAITSGTENWREPEQSTKFGPAFRLLSATIIGLTITSLVLKTDNWFPTLSAPIFWGSCFLISMGLLQLSLTSHPLKVILGLLTSLAGFEIIYAAIEASVLVTGLLAGINLGLALVGAYLITAPSMEASG